jgi:hypothetical protein
MQQGVRRLLARGPSARKSLSVTSGVAAMRVKEGALPCSDRRVGCPSHC